MKRMSSPLVFWSLALAGVCFADDSVRTFTPDQLWTAPITRHVGERIAIKAHLAWGGHNGTWYEAKADRDYPRAKDTLVFRLGEARPFIYWEGVFNIPLPKTWIAGVSAEIIPLVSEKLGRAAFISDLQRDTEVHETFTFKDLLLRQSKAYRLVGVLEYNDHMKRIPNGPPVNDPQFITQSNNPLYWNQTFVFRVEDVLPE